MDGTAEEPMVAGLPGMADVEQAARRIAPWVVPTPLLSSRLLNQWLGHEIVFKAECLQRVGAFKARGACNALASLRERGARPRLVVANSSGNHAQALAWAARALDFPVQIFMPADVSAVKAAATRGYGARVVLCPSRAEVDGATARLAAEPGVVWVHPFNQREVIAGQGTAALEALAELGAVDAVCVPCGGGGLLAGTSIVARQLCPAAAVIGVEPLAANDAARSRRAGSIQRLEHAPDTLADGARTLWVGDLTFPFIQAADAFYEVEEERIVYWTQWLGHLLKLRIEPTSAMAMEGVWRWLRGAPAPRRVLVILSGGNVATEVLYRLHERDYLDQPPAPPR